LLPLLVHRKTLVDDSVDDPLGCVAIVSLRLGLIVLRHKRPNDDFEISGEYQERPVTLHLSPVSFDGGAFA
jgi:hypothetical protein